MQRAALASSGVNAKGFAQASRAMQVHSKVMRDGAMSTGMWNAEQLKLNTAADDYNKRLAAQKLSLRDLRKEAGIAKAAYRDQLAMQQMVVRSAGKMGGKELFDVYTPTELHKDLDTTANRFGFLREQIASASHQMVNWGKNMQWAGRQLTVGLTMPVVAFGAAAGVMAYQIEDELTRIVKVYDTTADRASKDLDEIARAEKEVAMVRTEAMKTASMAAKEYAVAAQDTLSVQAELAATGLKGAELQNQTNEVIRIATLGELDYATATSAAISLQSVFRMGNEELAESFNYLNSIENATSLQTKDFAAAIPIAAAPVKAFGGDIQELGILLTAMREKGIEATQGANAIKAAMQRLGRPSQQIKDEFLALTGVEITPIVEESNNLTEIFTKLNKVTEGLDAADKRKVFAGLFGSYQVTRMMALTEGMGELEQGVGQVSRAYEIAGQSSGKWAEDAEREMKTMQESFAKQFKASVENAKIQLAKFGEPFVIIATKVINMVSWMLETFNKLPAGIKILAGLGIATAAIAGPVIMLIGLFANLAGNAGKFFVMLTRGMVNFELLNKETAAAKIANKLAEQGFIQTGSAVQDLTMKMERLIQSFQNANRIVGAGITPAPTNLGMHGPVGPTPIPVVAGGLTNAAGSQLLDRQGNPITTAMVYDTKEIEKNSRGIAKSWGTTSKLMGVGTAAMVASSVSSNQTADGYASMAMNAAFAASAISMLGIKMPTISKESAKSATVWKGISAVAGKTWSFIKMMPRAISWIVKAIGPWGWAIAAITGGYLAIRDAMGQAAQDQKAINNSSATWADTLGYTETALGSAGKHTGKIVSDMERITELGRQFAATNPAIVQRFLSYEEEADRMLFAQQQYITMRQTGASEEEAMKGIQILFAATGEEIQKVDEMMLKFQSNLAIGSDKTTRSVENLRSQFELFNADQKFWKPIDPDMGKFNWKFMWNESKAILDTVFHDSEGEAYEMGREMAEQIDHGLSTIKNPFARAEFMKDARKQLSDQFRQVFAGINEDTLDQLSSGAMKINTNNVEQMQRVIYDATRMGSTNFMEKYGVDYNSWMRLNEENISGYEDLNALEKGLLNSLKQRINSQSDANTLIGFMKDEQNKILGITKKQAMAEFRRVKGAQELAGRMAGTLETGDGLLKQNEELNKKQQLRVLNGLREEYGLKKTGRLLDWFGPATKRWGAAQKGVNAELAKGKGRVQELVAALKNADITSAFKDAMTSFQQGMVDQRRDSFEREYDNAMSSIEADADRRTSGLEARQEAATRRLEADQERRRNAVERSFDRRIDGIQNVIDAEEKAEETRQRIFEAELARIQRLSEMANQNIDFNVALNSGDLDEAAKIRNDMEAQAADWALGDAGDAATRKSEAKTDRLSKRIDQIEKVKDARLDAIAKVEEREKLALERTQERRKKALDNELEQEREAAEDRWETRREYAEKSYDDFMGYIARDEKDLQKWIKRWEKEHKGLSMTTQGQFAVTADNINSYIKQSVEKSGRSMVNEVDWETNGWEIARKLMKGAFGLSPAEFRKFIVTGKPPKDWADRPSGKPKKDGQLPSPYKGGTKLPWADVLHGGGDVTGTGGSGRMGYARTSGVHPNEVPVLAEKGEFMVNKYAAAKHRGLLENINSGKGALNKRSNVGNGVGGGGTGANITGMFGSMLFAALRNSVAGAVGTWGSAAISNYAAASGAAKYGSAKAGTYGDREFSASQLRNAKTIATVGKSMGMSARDIQIGIMTAITESGLVNVNYGDRDSLGLFQQRPSMGWGTAAQVTDPVYASTKFFQGLQGISGRGDMAPWLAAQAVQRSFDATGSNYRQYWDEAEAIFGALKEGGAKSGSFIPGSGGWHKPSVPGKGWSNTHDYRNGLGSPLYAHADGTVVESRAVTSGGSAGNGLYSTPYRSYGETIAIKGPDGKVFRYAHLSPGQRYVSAGQKVKGGSLIGRSGNTGNSSGPHTHFDVNGDYNASGYLASRGISLSKGASNIRWDNTIANLHKGEAVLTEDLNKKFHQGVERFAAGPENNYNVNVNVYGETVSADEIAEKVMTSIRRLEARKPQSRRG